MPKTKLISLITVGLVLAAGLGYFFGRFVLSSNPLFLLGAVIFSVFYLAFFLVRILLIRKISLSLLLITLEILVIDIFLLWHTPAVWLITSTIIALVFLFIAHQKGASEINNVLKIHFRNLQYMVLSTAILGITVFGIINYLSTVNIEKIAVQSLPGLSAKIKFGDLLEVLAKKVDYKIPPEVMERLRASSHSEENFTKSFQKLVSNILEKTPREFKVVFVVGLGIILFLTINGGTFMFVWIIGFVAWLIYKILLTTKFAHISLEKSQKETITL